MCSIMQIPRLVAQTLGRSPGAQGRKARTSHGFLRASPTPPFSCVRPRGSAATAHSVTVSEGVFKRTPSHRPVSARERAPGRAAAAGGGSRPSRGGSVAFQSARAAARAARAHSTFQTQPSLPPPREPIYSACRTVVSRCAPSIATISAPFTLCHALVCSVAGTEHYH